MKSYVNDGTEYTRGVGAVASLDPGGRASASAAFGLPGREVPTRRGMVRLVKAAPTVPLIYGETVPYPKWPMTTGAMFEKPSFGVTLTPPSAEAKEVTKEPIPRALLIGGAIVAGYFIWMALK